MVHTFKSLNRYFMLDVNTCSLFEIDEVAAAVCPFVENGGDYKELYKRYNPEEVDETYSELMLLKRTNQAFTNVDWSGEAINPGHDIKAMCLHVSHDCELRCKYCFAATGCFHGERQLMTLETGKKALDFLVKNSGKRKNLEVDFFGGEPLLNYDVVKGVMDYGKNVLGPKHKKNFRFTITTNGMGLNEDILKDFEEMYNVVVSVDGREKVHNNMRPDLNGKDTYLKIAENALKLKKSRNGKSYYVRGTYTSANTDFSKDVLHLADEGFDQISIGPVVLPDTHKYALKEEHLEKLFDEYEKLAAEYVERRKKPDTWFNFFHFMIDMECGPCIAKRLTGCGAGNEYIAITPAGDIYPCHQFVGNEEYKMGNIHQKTFDKEMQGLFAVNNVLSKPKCSDCWCKFFCSGGCAANAVSFNGDMFTPYEMSCELQKKRTECALAIYSVEKENKQQKTQ